MFSVQIDDREFTQALNDCIKASSRTMAEVVNGQAISLAAWAMKSTRTANPEKIRSDLGQAATALTIGKGGVAKRGKLGGVYRRKGRAGILLPGESIGKGGRRIARETNAPITLAHKLVLKTIWKRNQTWDQFKNAVPDRHALDEMARKVIAARTASVHYVRSGWHGALDILFSISRVRRGLPAGTRGWKQTDVWKGKRPRGIAWPALPDSEDPFAIIQTTSLGQRKGQAFPEGGKVAIAEAGLREGFRLATLDMRKHLAEKFGKLLRDRSAKR